jgi:hypothetical protein
LGNLKALLIPPPMPSPCSLLCQEYKNLQALKASFVNVYEKVKVSGDLAQAKTLKAELEKARDVLQEKFFVVIVRDALNPFHEALQKNKIPEAQNPERHNRKVDLLEVLKADIASYQGSNLKEWVEALKAIKNDIRLTREKFRIIEQELADGAIPIFMPGAKVQQDTTPEQYMQNIKPIWKKEGQPQALKDAYMGDHIKHLITTKDASLVQGVPSRPYLLLVKPTQKPHKDTCGRTLNGQIAELARMNAARSGRATLGSIKPLEYAALQQRFTQSLATTMPPLSVISPLDSSTIWTKFIDLPVADGYVPCGLFIPSFVHMKFGRSDADIQCAISGFRPVVRVEL